MRKGATIGPFCQPKEWVVYQYILIAAVAWFTYGSTVAHAQALYKWVDSRGGIHYTNTPTNNKARTVDDALPPASHFQSLAPPEPAKSSDDAAKENTPTSSNPQGETTPEPPQSAAVPTEEPQASEQ
jgi:hypothetical protein